MKKDATEAGYITDIMTRFIFAHPEISFKLIIDNKEKLFSPGDNSLENSVYTVYGRDYAKGTIPVEYESDGIKITGLIGKGTLARPKRNYQSFFVNRRYITSRTIIAALENAYKNQIMIGKFPMAILNIEINPSLIDINVHPTKLEVKFSDEKAVYNAVYYGVKNALYEIPNVPKIERTSEEFKRDTPKGQLNLSDLAVALPKTMTKRPETTAYNPRENHFLKNSGDTKNNSVSDNKTDKVGDTKTQNNFVSLKPDFIKPRQPEIPYTRTVSLETPKAETNGILPKKDAVKAEEVNVEELLSDVTLAKLQTIFHSVMKKQVDKIDPIRSKFGKIEKESVTLADRMLFIEEYAMLHQKFSFRQMLESQPSKTMIIVSFLGILELMKVGKLKIVQENIFDDIYITYDNTVKYEGEIIPSSE